jgi:hypothetical protein
MKGTPLGVSGKMWEHPDQSSYNDRHDHLVDRTSRGSQKAADSLWSDLRQDLQGRRKLLAEVALPPTRAMMSIVQSCLQCPEDCDIVLNRVVEEQDGLVSEDDSDLWTTCVSGASTQTMSDVVKDVVLRWSQGFACGDILRFFSCEQVLGEICPYTQVFDMQAWDGRACDGGCVDGHEAECGRSAPVLG